MNWLIKILLFTSSFEVFGSAQKVAGTPGRLEYEHKLAFWLPETVEIRQNRIGQLIKESIGEAIAERRFLFDQQIYSTYSFAEQFQTFAFVDYYFDDKRRSLIGARSAYRLRYRWSHFEKYLRFQMLPFVGAFYPDRCEVQFKHGYKADQKTGAVAVDESRFEFRKESQPFSSGASVPEAPWDSEDFLKTAQTGAFRGYRMLPYDNMDQLIGGLDKQSFGPVLKVVTARYRSHLTVPSPWGSGPNPDHDFIITMDRSTVPGSNRTLLEFETEIDRNISTLVDQVSQIKAPAGTLEAEASRFSKLARVNMEKDLRLVRDLIKEVVAEEVGLEPLPTSYKYRRLSGIQAGE